MLLQAWLNSIACVAPGVAQPKEGERQTEPAEAEGGGAARGGGEGAAAAALGGGVRGVAQEGAESTAAGAEQLRLHLRQAHR